MPPLNRAILSWRAQALQRRRTIQQLNRSFSSSQPCLAYFPPAFAPTSSPEMDGLLQLIREKVLLPRHLRGDTKKLVSNPKRSEQLEMEDIRIQIGAEEEQLKPHNYGKDGVSWHETFERVLRSSLELDDFSMWQSLLKGAKGADLALDARKREVLVRKMCISGNTTTLLRLLETLSEKEFPAPSTIPTQLPHAIRIKALTSDFEASAQSCLADVDPKAKEQFLRAVQNGSAVDELLEKVPGLARAQLQALQRGLKQALQLNLVLARRQQPKALIQFCSRADGHLAVKGDESDKTISTQRQDKALADPILATVPLELQSLIESLVQDNPTASQTAEASDESAQSTVSSAAKTTAADYARRLLSALEAQPISSIPTSLLSTIEISRADHPRLVAMRQEIWLSRALLVASSLRAATEAPTVVQDKALLSNVTRQLRETETALAAAHSLLHNDNHPRHRVMLGQYARYRAGLSWGAYGQHTYPMK